MTPLNPLDHLPLVRYHARQIAALSTEPLDDLYQEGCIGLLKACERYEPMPGLGFASYARPWIRGEMLHYIRQQIGRKNRNGQFVSKVWHRAISLDSIADAADRFADWQGISRAELRDNLDLLAAIWFSRWERKPTERQVLELLILNGLKGCEVAKILDCSEQTIWRWRRDAIARLRWAYLFEMGEASAS